VGHFDIGDGPWEDAAASPHFIYIPVKIRLEVHTITEMVFTSHREAERFAVVDPVLEVGLSAWFP
jgi:hypothetical protein